MTTTAGGALSTQFKAIDTRIAASDRRRARRVRRKGVAANKPSRHRPFPSPSQTRHHTGDDRYKPCRVRLRVANRGDLVVPKREGFFDTDLELGGDEIAVAVAPGLPYAGEDGARHAERVDDDIVDRDSLEAERSGCGPSIRPPSGALAGSGRRACRHTNPGFASIDRTLLRRS
jgi:hypothetical protein